MLWAGFKANKLFLCLSALAVIKTLTMWQLCQVCLSYIWPYSLQNTECTQSCVSIKPPFWFFWPSLCLWSADILREFNANLTGFSEGICKADSPQAFLNQAVAGAKSGSVTIVTFGISIHKSLAEERIFTCLNYSYFQWHGGTGAHAGGQNESRSGKPRDMQICSYVTFVASFMLTITK